MVKPKKTKSKEPKVSKPEEKKVVKIKEPYGIFGKMKASIFKEKVEVKLPEFKVEKPKLVVLPEGKQIDFKYSLIEPFAQAHLKWDSKNKELVYNITEPIMNKEEQEIYEKIIKAMLEVIDVDLSSLKGTEQAIDYLEEQIQKILTEYDIQPKKESYLKIMYHIYRNFIGLNEIEPLMQDPYIEDISCDGVNIPLYIVHRKYGSIKTNIVFVDNEKLREFIVKISERCGRFISYAEPLLDGTLPDGSRVQASFSKDVTTRGPSFTIRRFREEPMSPIDLINNGTLNSEMLAYLWLAVESGASILVGGGAATGKTTFMNVISMFIPPGAKVISIEDTRELNLTHENWLPSVTRAAFAKGYGEVTMFDLLKESFRQTPDYVIVGEVRGQEAYVMFQGMAAGFPAMGTIHAGRVEDIIHRLETPPINLSPTLIDTLDIVIIMVHARERGESARRIKEIVEIESIDPKTGHARTSRIFNWLAAEDSFQHVGSSWLLQQISRYKGTTLEKTQKEVSIRKKILDWMIRKKTTNFKEVTKTISEYYKDPQSILKQIKL